jgi:uncharacterized protein GlcG (DUF336 family)
MHKAMRQALAVGLVAVSACAQAQDATFAVRMMTIETALQAARAALESCRKAGFQVAVAVVDRAGLAQVVLRDRFAGAHTTDMAVDKAWTAASFRTSTAALAEATEAGKPASGIRQRPRVAAVAGGVVIEGAGTMLGAIGVSGAPGGDRDEACARAGIAAIQHQLDF